MHRDPPGVPPSRSRDPALPYVSPNLPGSLPEAPGGSEKLTLDLERERALRLERDAELERTRGDMARLTGELQARAAELERSNGELQRFAYVASHDLKEPLRKVQAFGDRLRVQYAGALDARGADYLARMLGATARMQALIDHLLAYSRVNTDAQAFQEVNLESLAHSVVEDLEPRIQENAGRVTVGPLPTIQGDPSQLRQLLQNLLSNALKFHRPGEPPVVEVTWVTTEGDPQRECRLAVRDHGIGIEPEYLERIFLPFERVHGRGQYEGTGLGLAICQRIARRHGGRVTAHGNPGQGSQFIVVLPCPPPETGGDP